MRVAVLGHGAEACAMAADLARAGHTVALGCGAEPEAAALERAGGVNLRDRDRGGPVPLALVTRDLARAVSGAEVVVAAVPATAHQELAARLVPHLAPEQVVVLTAGLLGALVVARELARSGRVPYAVVETALCPVVARPTAAGEVTVVHRAAEVPLGVFPAARTAETLGRLRTVLPAARACADVLDAALTSPAPVLYPALVLLHLGVIERGPRDAGGLGATASVRRLREAVDRERCAARDGWGYGPIPESVTLAQAQSGEASGTATVDPHETIGLDHRYVTEAGALGLSLFESAARSVGVEAPATTGLLLVYGALLGRRLQGQGRALEFLGLGDFLLREIRALLHEGWTSALWARLLR